jgi:hypothetical protein
MGNPIMKPEIQELHNLFDLLCAVCAEFALTA